MPPAGLGARGFPIVGGPSRARSSIAARGEVRYDGCGQRVPEGDADAVGEFAQEGLGPEDGAEQAEDKMPAQTEHQADASPRQQGAFLLEAEHARADVLRVPQEAEGRIRRVGACEDV